MILWWTPPIALALARFPLGRLRFASVIAMASALAEGGGAVSPRCAMRRSILKIGRATLRGC